MKLERVGLIVNPHAGRGDAIAIARDAIRALAPREILVGAGAMGADAVRDQSARVFDWSAHAGTARTKFLAQQFANENVDALIVIGGDGTLADVALTIAPRAVPLLGIGAGSANVGPLMTCANVTQLANARFATRALDGLIAGVNDGDLGLGFNDVVLDFTVLATVNDQIVNVDAAQKMIGANIPRDPEPVWTNDTRIVKKHARGETLVAHGDQVATMIVGLPDERFYGKAIAGGVILSSMLGDPAGCLVCNHLLVTTRVDRDAYYRAEPIISRYVGLNETDRVESTGLRDGVALCADGNPLKILRGDDRVQVRVARGLATSIRIEEST